MGMFSPRLSRSAASRSTKRRIGLPPTCDHQSKVRSPARYAGESGRGTPITARGRLGYDAELADLLDHVELAPLDDLFRA